MTNYRVIWEIDLEADSPEEAVNKVWNIFQDQNSTATTFRVIDRETMKVIERDFAKDIRKTRISKRNFPNCSCHKSF